MAYNSSVFLCTAFVLPNHHRVRLTLIWVAVLLGSLVNQKGLERCTHWLIFLMLSGGQSGGHCSAMGGLERMVSANFAGLSGLFS